VLAAVAESWQERPHEIEAMGRELLAQLDETNDLARHLSDSYSLRPFWRTPSIPSPLSSIDSTAVSVPVPSFPSLPIWTSCCVFMPAVSARNPWRWWRRLSTVWRSAESTTSSAAGFTAIAWIRSGWSPLRKMLYDNAQLAQTYIRCYQATGKTFYRGVAEEILEYVMREMTSPEGGFYSAQDADSEGEGRFFVWTPAAVRAILGERDAEVFGAFFDITPGGNWEGTNILHVIKEAPQVAEEFGLSVEETATILDTARARLLAEREKRIKPHLDDKILTAWNGLMLAAFAEVAAVLDNIVFRQVAVRNAQFLLQTMTTRTRAGICVCSAPIAADKPN